MANLNLNSNEIFYFNDTSAVRKMLLGAPRTATQSALSLPYQYIRDPILENVAVDQIPSELPDISIAYKLHLECGKLINLYDWFQVNNSVHEIQPQSFHRRRFTAKMKLSNLKCLGGEMS